MRRFMLAASLLAFTGAPAWARSQREVAYPFDQVWPAAVRFLRVDAKLKILEKDQDNGYVLFEYAEGDRKFQGSEELIKFTDGSGRPSVRCVLTINDRPEYLEIDLLDRFEEKLHVELGPEPQPPPPKEDPPPAPPKDKDAPKDIDEDH